jgi:exonuclease III
LKQFITFSQAELVHKTPNVSRTTARGYQSIHQQPLKKLARKKCFKIGALNIQGLAMPAKHHEIIAVMKSLQLDILIISELKVKNTGEYEVSDYRFSLSCEAQSPGASHSGVGIVIAPTFKKFVSNITPISDRIITAKIHLAEGPLTIIGVYAPQGGRDLSYRQHFYKRLQATLNRQTSQSPTLIMGDLSARWQGKNPLAEEFLGPYIG